MDLYLSLFPGGVHTDVIKWIKGAFQHNFPEVLQEVSEQHDPGSFQVKWILEDAWTSKG